jgi:Caspase domain
VKAVAIIVGIDDYRDQPLTSAVNDALAFRDALVELDLVDAGSITLLTSPAQPGSPPATRNAITAALREQYLHGDEADRMYVFFSGHGMQVQTKASHATSATAFLPADISDPMSEPWNLLNIEDLWQSFHFAGPREQFFFIDACRDLKYPRFPPDIGPIGLTGREQPPVGDRDQAMIYAVTPGQRAQGARNGLGVMTGYLLEALHGAGEALDFDDQLDSHVITAQSVYKYVKARISQQVSGQLSWQQAYMLPRPDFHGETGPIRRVSDPGPASLTLTVDPPGDAEYVSVTVLQRGAQLARPRWPPAQFGTPVEVPRQLFRLSAGSHHGATGVEPELIDGRTMTSALIRHKYLGPRAPGPALPPAPTPVPDDPAPGPAVVSYSESRPVITRGGVYGFRKGGRQPGWLELVVAEPWATADIVGLDPPYRSHSAQLSRGQDPAIPLPPGSYQVRFRVGSEQFSETIAEIEDGRATTVQASAFASPLVAAVTGQTEHGKIVELAEHFGPVQANPALTLTTLIALSRAHGLSHPLGIPDVLPPARRPSPDRWLSLAVAVDGSAWEPSAVAGELTAEITTPGFPYPNEIGFDRMGARAGLDQIVGGTAIMPLPNCTLAVGSARIGRIELTLAAARRMVTAVGIVLRADGGIDVAQLLTPLHLTESAIGAQVRRSLLSQWLYRSGELIDYEQRTASAQFQDIVTGAAADPVLSPMAYHALSRMLAADRPGLPRSAQSDRERIGRRLVSEFPEHVDSAVIAEDLGGGLSQSRGLARYMLANGRLPLLADSLSLAAADPGGLPAQAAEVAATIRPGSLWTLRWTQPHAGGD